MIKKTLSLVILLASFYWNSTAQEKLQIGLKNTTSIGSDNQLPFWFTANQLGKIETQNGTLNLTEFNIGQTEGVNQSKLSYSWGALGVAGWSDQSYLQLNQAFAGLHFKGWQLVGGLFADETQWGGLSTSNGNMARTQNARPYPKIRFSTQGYQPIPFIPNWAFFNAEYDEGLLNDDRYVDQTRLHHKSLTLSIRPNSQWDFRVGLDHFVMWAGVSPDPHYGKLPATFKDYLIYISGSQGDQDFPETDQINIAGNQLGTYNVQLIYKTNQYQLAAYLSHFFEDRSGLNWRNWNDNLAGIHLSFNEKNRFISEVLYEYTSTRNQSVHGDYRQWVESTQTWVNQESDSYFSHGVYRTGYSYHHQMMSTPLVVPTFDQKNRLSFASNRLFAHHIGWKGHIDEQLSWNGKITWIQSWGTYQIPFNPKRNQLSTLVGITYSTVKLPFLIGLSTAADFNDHNGNHYGVQLQLSKSW